MMGGFRPSGDYRGPDTCAEWKTYADKLEGLCRWLALPFGDNVPVFAKALPDGRPLETGIMMEALYKEVMGPRDYQPTAGHWVQCPACHKMSVERNDITEQAPYCALCIHIADQWNEHRNGPGGHVPAEVVHAGIITTKLSSEPPA